MRKVKARSTILKEQRRLRQIVDLTSTMPGHVDTVNRIVSEAYAAETALTWVLDDCDWTPSGLLKGEIDSGR